MKEVFENIKEKIKNQPIEQFVDTNGNWDLVQTVLDCCCEAVDRVKEEYNNGWISCSDKLPPQPKENPAFDNKALELYLVSDGYSDYPFRAFWNGKFFVDGFSSVDAIAWQPLPNPFKPIAE